MPSIQTTIARELNLTAAQVAAVIDLVDQGNTIPFIARYRKEATGGIDDATLRDLDERLTYLRNLEARKDEVLRAIEEQGKLTADLRAKIDEATMSCAPCSASSGVGYPASGFTRPEATASGSLALRSCARMSSASGSSPASRAFEARVARFFR